MPSHSSFSSNTSLRHGIKIQQPKKGSSAQLCTMQHNTASKQVLSSKQYCKHIHHESHVILNQPSEERRKGVTTHVKTGGCHDCGREVGWVFKGRGKVGFGEFADSGFLVAQAL